MGKKVVALLAISTILLGCKGNGLIPDKSNDETLQDLDELFATVLKRQRRLSMNGNGHTMSGKLLVLMIWIALLLSRSNWIVVIILMQPVLWQQI